MGNLANYRRAASARKPLLPLLLAALCFALIRCGGGDPGSPTNAELSVISGANQSADVGGTLSSPIVVRVEDPETGGKPGVRLRAKLSGGGSVTPSEATTDNSGLASFSWTLANATGTQQLVIEGTQVDISVTVTATAHTVAQVASVSVSPGTTQLSTGQTQQFSATLRDAGGAILTGRAVEWRSSNNAVASVSTDGLVTGVATGPATITATSDGISGTATVSVSNLIPTQLVITRQPGGAINALPMTTQPIVEVRDAFGLLVANSTASVTASIENGPGILSGTLTVDAVNGVATFSDLRISGIGAHTLRFTSVPLTSATSEVFQVPLGPSSLRVVTQPAGAVSGIAFTTQPTVEVLDQNGARYSGAPVQITASRELGSGTLGGTLTATSNNGLATFANLQFSGSGLHSIRFSAGSVNGVSSLTFDVATGPAAASLAIRTQPGGSTIGVDLTTQPVIEIRDANGQIAVGTTAAVTASIASGNPLTALSGTTTVQAVNGVATFTDLRINAGAGNSNTLIFTAPGVSSVTSSGFVVSAGSGAPVLVKTTEPGGATTGVNFSVQPALQVHTSFGDLDITSSAPVTATIASGNGTLSGTTVVNAVNGVVTFTNLRITGSGTHTLRYASPGMTSVTSAPFVVATSPASFGLNVGNATPASVTAGQNLAVPVTLDMSNGGGAAVGSFTFNLNWDPAKFSFASISVNNGSTFFITTNTTNSAAGTIAIGAFSTAGTTPTQLLVTVTLTANASAGGTSSAISAQFTAAADNNGNAITITPRNLTANITP